MQPRLFIYFNFTLCAQSWFKTTALETEGHFRHSYLTLHMGYLSSVENSSSGQFMVMAMFITTVIWFTCSLLNCRYTLNIQVSFRLLEVIVSFWFSFQKMYAYPVFPRQSATSTRLLMVPSVEAKHLENVESGRAKPNKEVLAEVLVSFVSTSGGDPSDQFLVLAHCKLQFGKYQGQRFIWLLENSLGYAVYLVLSISKETAQKKKPVRK